MESSPRPRFPNHSPMMSSFSPIDIRQKIVRGVIDEWATSDIDHYGGEGTIRAYVSQVKGDHRGAYCGFMGSVYNALMEENQTEHHHMNKWWLNHRAVSRYLRILKAPRNASVELLLREISEQDLRVTGMIDA